MKKIVLLTTLIGFAASAFAGEPKITGFINKALKSTTQEKVNGRVSSVIVSDVTNAYSRFGVTGTHDIQGTMKGTYNFETDIGDTAAFKIRLANIDVSDVWGTLTVGKAYRATGLNVLQLDPLWATPAGAIGVDQASDIANGVFQLGYTDSDTFHLFGYKTPVFKGLQFSVTQDRGNDKTNYTTPRVETTSMLLNYKNDFSFGRLIADVGYNKTVGTIYKSNNVMVADAALVFGQFAVALGLTKRAEQAKAANAFKEENTHSFGAVSYTMGKTQLALTYAHRKVKEASAASATAAELGKHTQIALGVNQNFAEKLVGYVTAAQYKYKTDKAGLSGNALKLAEADALAFSMGARLSF